MSKDSRRGQSLIELVIGITVGVLFITAALGLITVSLKIDFQNKFSQTASELNQELIEEITAYSNSKWGNVYKLPRSTPHILELDGTGDWFTDTPTQTIVPVTISDTDYTTSFTVEDVSRDTNGYISNSIFAVLDPSTLKIIVTTDWNQAGSPGTLSLSKYITRIRNRVWRQTDWSGGATPAITYTAADYDPIGGPNGNHYATVNSLFLDTTTNLVAPFIPPTFGNPGEMSIDLLTALPRYSSGVGIDTINHWAWNDVVGWLNFAYGSANPVKIYRYPDPDTGTPTLSGSVGSSVGPISLDCARSPSGNICSAPSFSYSVIKSSAGANDGYFSGWAWNDTIGWISFNCDHTSDGTPAPDNTNTCATANYNVSLTGGDFFGWAWNDIVGWISFNCSDASICGTHPYLVRTTNSIAGALEGKLESAKFNFGDQAEINSIMWLGTKNGGSVEFKIATSDCLNGDDNAPTCNDGLGWRYYGPDTGNNNLYYTADSGVPIPVTRINHAHKQYMRYYIYLLSDASLTQSPTVEDVIVNWSL